MSRVLITGAAGLLGSALVRAFAADGWTVRAADLVPLRVEGIEGVVCDITRADEVAAAMHDVDVVVHAAGLFDLTAPEERLHRINAHAVVTVCDQAAAAGVSRLVLVSSTGVYGACGRDASEEAPKRPASPYERSKWEGEWRARDRCARRGLPLAVLRPTLIYGPGSRYGLAPALAVFALRERRGHTAMRIARGGPIGHVVHVTDVAAAAVLAATHAGAIGGAINVADARPIPAGTLIRTLASTAGVEILEPAPPWAARALYKLLRGLAARKLGETNAKVARSWSRLVADEGLVDALVPRIDLGFLDYVLFDHSYDTARLRALGFRWRHPDPVEGITEAAAWYRAHRWLPARPPSETPGDPSRTTTARPRP